MPTDTFSLPAVRHVARDFLKEGGIGNLEHGPAVIADLPAPIAMAAWLAVGDGGVHAEQPQQRPEFLGEGMAADGQGHAAMLGAHRTVGIDETGQKRQEMPFGIPGDPAGHPQVLAFLADLIVDQLGGAAGREAGDGEVPDGRAIDRGRGHYLSAAATEGPEESGIALHHLTLGRTDLEHQAAPGHPRAPRPGPTAVPIVEVLFAGAAITQVRPGEPGLVGAFRRCFPGQLVMHQGIGFLHFVGPHPLQTVVPIHQHRMLDGGLQDRAIGADLDVLLARYMGGEMALDTPHLETPSRLVVGEDLSMFVAYGLVCSHQAMFGDHQGAGRHAPRLQRQPRLMHLGEDVVHGIVDGAGDGAVDGGGGRLVLPGAGVGDDAAGGDGAVAQGPQEALVPLAALGFRLLHLGQGAGDAPVGGVQVGVHRFAGVGLEAVFLVPDVQGGALEGDLGDLVGDGLEFDVAHVRRVSSGCSSRRVECARRAPDRESGDHNMLWLWRSIIAPGRARAR